jgi:5-methylthioadenosine/S-adenosylhomocysteine deaminase
MPEALPGLDPMRSVVYSGRSKSVDTVVVNGRVIVKDGRSTRFDEAELYARSRELSLGVMRRMGLSAPQGRWPRLD